MSNKLPTPEEEILLDIAQIERDVADMRHCWKEKRWHSLVTWLKTDARQIGSTLAKLEKLILEQGRDNE